MVEKNSPRTPPPSPDGDGVRVIQKARNARRSALVWLVIAIAVIGTLVAWRVLMQKHATPAAVVSDAASVSDPDANAESVSAAARPSRQPASWPAQSMDVPNNDPNDLANYFRPGDPEPTGAELIGALNDVGIHTGIGAFNPPGTSPPLEGLAVPDDYVLPDGYVRHHQSSDDGVAIEPILMFAPDFALYDASGQPIPLPANRVVPPELAPPGLPVRWVHIPTP